METTQTQKYEFGSFDKYGNLNGSYFVGIILGSLIIFYLLSIVVSSYIKIGSIDFNYMFNILKNSYNLYNTNFKSFVSFNSFYLILPFLIVIIYIYTTFKNKGEQRKLSNYGLENYYLKKKLKDGYIYNVVPGESMDYDKFLKQFDNMTQRNGKGSCLIQRYDKVGVKVRFKHKTPAVEELKGLKVVDYVKKGYLFLGFSGGFNKKRVPQYIKFSDLPHSFSLLGTSGGGKSNTLNHILFSIFYNFENVFELNFIDFKGGVESQPYLKLEEKHKTNKINTYTSSRLELYKKLIRLDIVNKSRQQYLISKNKKKFNSLFIYVFFDEISEILDYKGNTKEDKIIQDKTKEIIESLFRTGRSSGFKLFFATQIFTSVGSGISNSIKNNTIFRILHKTESQEGIQSVIDKEPLEERGINVKEFQVGEMVIKNEDKYYNVRSLYIPDNFINTIKLNNKKIPQKFINEMNQHILKTIESYSFEDKIYSKNDCLKDFNINNSNNINLEKDI